MAGTSVSTTRRWSKRLRETGSADDNPRSGRPRKTTPLDDAAIVRASELNHRASNKAIRHQLHLPISENTVGRRLDAAGLPSCIAANKIQYTDKERRKRLSFAHGYEHWTAEDWEKLIISDEVTIEGEGRKRHQRVRRPAGHRFDPEYTVHTQIYAPSRHLFACFCSRGPGYCKMYEGKLDGKALKGLLERTLLETARDYYQTDPLKPGHEQWWFQHDNSPPFRSRKVQNWLHNNGINVLDFPPRSPDLNPIENLWPRVHKLMDELHPTTNEAVADAFIQRWPDVSLDTFTDFAQSMPTRIAAVIAANGDATKY
jgi:transposase